MSDHEFLVKRTAILVRAVSATFICATVDLVVVVVVHTTVKTSFDCGENDALHSCECLWLHHDYFTKHGPTP